MSSKYIKPFVVILFFVFIFVTVLGININNKDERLMEFQVELEQTLAYNKDVKLFLKNTYTSLFINYDNLTKSNIEYKKALKKIQKNYPEQKQIPNIIELAKIQSNNIEHIKRANSVLINSFYYIRTLAPKIFGVNTYEGDDAKILRELTRKTVDLSLELKLGNQSIFEDYKLILKKINSLKVRNQKLSRFKEELYIHSNMILKQSRKIKKHLNRFNTLNETIDYTYSMVRNKILKKHKKVKSTTEVIQSVLFIILLIFIYLVVRFLRIENNVKKEQKRLQELVDKYIIITQIDEEKKIINVSKAFCDISGYSKSELLNKDLKFLRNKEDDENKFKQICSTLENGNIWRGEVPNKRKDGSVYWTDTILEPVFNEKKEIVSYVGIRTDITDKIKLRKLSKEQEQIIEAQTKVANEQRDKAIDALNAKSEFLANMSHEIRTPLNAILGFVNILKDNVAKDENKKHLEIIDNSSHHLLGIINDILDFSKIENGKLFIEKVSFEAKKEFASTVVLHEAKAKEKAIDLEYNVDKNLPKFLTADSLRIKQVISNLLSNAIKFSNENSKVQIDISYKEEKLDISIKDEGIGIEESKLSHIFEPFLQEDSTTTRKYGGTGLGLAICSRLVEIMGGELKVQSKKNEGSRFYFSIPVDIGEEKLIKDKKVSEGNFENKKLLLVEDNKANQMFMKVVLKKLNFNTIVANDGIEAIDKFKKEKFDVILMDENMPNMNGIEATKHILTYEKENKLEHTPIIALTANALKGDREKFLSAGLDEYLTKPLDKEKLINILNKLLKDK